jgi:signal transduction histidine kinase
VRLTTEPIELGELAGTMASELVATADAAGVTLAVEAGEPVWAVGDPRAAARVMRVFLDNALRHGARPGTVVTIAVEAAGSHARVRVTDEGPGVPEADRERVFGRFERGAAAGSGFGLGLAIARGLARQMGGDVRVRDRGPGACFEATLPGCAAPEDAPAQVLELEPAAVVAAAQSSGQS